MSAFREVRWLVAFTLGSALVGPLIFTPPLWDEYRRQQIAGFTIGLLVWGLAATAILSVVL